MNQPDGRNALGLRLIGGFKFASGMLLLGLGIGLFRNAQVDPADQVEHLVAALKLDHDNQYIHEAIEKVSGVSPKQLRVLGAGTFLYALMYLVEGGGLLMRRHWAEYLTVVATGLFIPLEIYEVVRRPTILRIGVLAINVAIVAYLVYQLRRKPREETAQESTAASPSPGGPVT